jgi:DoxX-like family
VSRPTPQEANQSAETAAHWLRWGVAFVWLWTGFAVLHPHYRALGEASLAPLGLPPEVMYATCAAEVVLGLRVALGRAATWLTVLQLVVIVGFTAILSASQPRLWLSPLGVLTKNIPLMVMIGTAWLLEREGWSRRAFWLLQGGLVVFWMVDGLAWLLTSEPAFVGPAWQVGCIELVLALSLLRPPGCPALLVLLAQLFYLVVFTVVASLREPLLWFHPFGPLTKNLPILVATIVLTCGGWTAWARRSSAS